MPIKIPSNVFRAKFTIGRGAFGHVHCGAGCGPTQGAGPGPAGQLTRRHWPPRATQDGVEAPAQDGRARGPACPLRSTDDSQGATEATETVPVQRGLAGWGRRPVPGRGPSPRSARWATGHGHPPLAHPAHRTEDSGCPLSFLCLLQPRGSSCSPFHRIPRSPRMPISHCPPHPQGEAQMDLDSRLGRVTHPTPALWPPPWGAGLADAADSGQPYSLFGNSNDGGYLRRAYYVLDTR